VLTPDLIEETLAPPEFEENYKIDNTPDVRQPVAILIKMRQEVLRHVNEAWGFKERFAKTPLHICNEAGSLYDMITMIITTPIPFPYVHLCKFLLLVFLFSVPLIIDAEEGFFANVVVPSCVAMSLLGIDAIATEIENPFGDDANDLDVTGAIAALEAECILFLELCGDKRAVDAFMFYEIPEALQDGDERSPHQFVCLRSQVRLDATQKSLLEEDAALAAGSNKKTRAGRRASFDIPDSVDDNTASGVRSPLLGASAASSMGGFVPMKEFGTETLVLEETADQDLGPTTDVVGLSDTESAADDSPARSLSQSMQGFRPMPDFGTQTIDLRDALQDGEAGADVIGLSDDSESSKEGSREFP